MQVSTSINISNFMRWNWTQKPSMLFLWNSNLNSKKERVEILYFLQSATKSLSLILNLNQLRLCTLSRISWNGSLSSSGWAQISNRWSAPPKRTVSLLISAFTRKQTWMSCIQLSRSKKCATTKMTIAFISWPRNWMKSLESTSCKFSQITQKTSNGSWSGRIGWTLTMLPCLSSGRQSCNRRSWS